MLSTGIEIYLLPQRRTNPREVARLRSEVSHHRQIVNSTQQELQLSVRRTRCILRDFVTGKIDSSPCQSSLSVPVTLEPGASSIDLRRSVRNSCVGNLENVAKTLVVRHVEVLGLGWRGLESLETVPGHVLDGDEGAVGEEEEVEETVANDGVVGTFDNGWERSESGWEGLVTLGEEVFTTAANEVVGRRSVNHFLDIRSVEVVVWSTCERRESELIPQVRAEICQVVDVETWVDIVDCVIDVIEKITTGLSRGWGSRNWAWWREAGGVRLEEISVTARLRTCSNVR
jgi:hypothetical protein